MHKNQKNLRPHHTHWTIEPADWRDFTQLHHLERACFKKEDFWSFWDLIGVLTIPGYVRLKAVKNDLMIGFLGGERHLADRTGWVTTIATLPEYQGQGVGAELLAAGENALGTPIIRLTVRESNHAAIRLYQRAGYVVVKKWQNYYVGGEDALVFEKRR
jgi:ribosomal-protein-alanine N-acetyltransferase